MKKTLSIINLILYICLTVFLLIGVHQLDIFSFKYVIVIYFLLALIGCIQLATILRKNKKSWVYYFGNILTILASIGLVFVSFKVQDTSNFLKENANATYETSYYYLISNDKKEFSADDINKSGLHTFADDELIYGEVMKMLTSDGISNVTASTDINELLSNFLKDEVPYLLISNNRYDMISEESSIFKEKSIVLKKYEIQVKVEPDKGTGANETPNVSQDLSKKPFILYISGIDTYGTISTRSRSDVNIIAAVNPLTKKVLLVHIPRDYYVPLAGKTGLKDKLTHSGIYGINTSMKTIENLMNIDISYYLRVNFNTLETLVDTIGGITIDSDTAFKAWTNSKCEFVVGMNPVNGSCALAFSRERHAYASGDRHRGENQEQVISLIIDKVSKSSQLIMNYSEILKAMNGHLQTNMSTNEITSIIKMQISDMASWSINSLNVDGSGASDYTYSMPSTKLYVMIPNMTTVNNATKKINEVLGR